MLRAPRLIKWIVSLVLLFLGLMTLLRGVTYVAFHLGASPFFDTVDVFLLGLRFDARVVASAVLPLLVLGSLPFFNPFKVAAARRVWFALLGFFSAALVVLYVCDFLHFRYLNQRLNASVLGFLADARISANMAWQTYPVVRIGVASLAATIFLVWLIVISHRRTAAFADSTTRAGRIMWFVGALLACLVAIFGRVGQYPLRWSDAFRMRGDFNANLALNPVQSLFSSLSFRSSGFDLERVKAHYPRMSAYLGVTKPDAQRLSFERIVSGNQKRAASRPNVILVICESFSAYKSSMWGNPLNTTPFFGELCQQGIFFASCYTPHFGTARGVWATITGIPDVQLVETASRNPAMVDQHTIINNFAGYEKYYFLGGSSSWANIRGLLTNNIEGLRLFEENSYKSPRIDVWGISDKNLFLEANGVLKQERKPFFAIIQTADNHRPYTIPKEDLPEFSKVDVPSEMLRQHGFESIAELNAFRYTDFCFRKFMEAARSSAYFDTTIFVFVGDHGIGGNAGSMFPPAWTENGLTAFHVPLLFYAPKLLPSQRVKTVASMVDILPTIAGMAGISYRNSGIGRDLLKQQDSQAGADNVAFIVDHNNKSIGAIKGSAYTTRQIRQSGYRKVWADFNKPSGLDAMNKASDDDIASVEGFFETSRYLLLNNRKTREP